MPQHKSAIPGSKQLLHRTGESQRNTIVSAVGELDICDLCESSPHAAGCPQHPDYDDDRIAYVRTDAREEKGPASYWVDDTYAAAARDEGVEPGAALREGIVEFRKAVEQGALMRISTGRSAE